MSMSAAVTARPVSGRRKTSGDWEVTSYEDPSNPGRVSEDGLTFVNFGRFFRLVIVDGVPRLGDSPPRPELEGGEHYASRIVLDHFRRALGLESAAQCANRDLFNRFSRVPTRDGPGGRRAYAPSMGLPQAAFAAVDCTPNGDGTFDVSALRGADCSVWIRREGSKHWEPLLTGPDRLPDGVAAMRKWRDENPYIEGGPETYEARRERQLAREEEVFGQPDSWFTTTLGRFRRPKLQSATAKRVVEIALGSDGAKLTADRLEAGMDRWMSEIRHKEATGGLGDDGGWSTKKHDDLALLGARILSR